MMFSHEMKQKILYWGLGDVENTGVSYCPRILHKRNDVSEVAMTSTPAFHP